MFQLTKGSLRKILDGANVPDPILQIMNIKNIQNNMDGLTRYKVTLYDGEIQHTFGILATQKNSLVENNELAVGSVIKLEEFASNVLSKDPPKVVVILLNFEILGEMDTTIAPTTTPATANSASSASAGEQNSHKTSNNHIQNENIEPTNKAAQEKAPSNVSKNFYAKDSQANTPGKNTTTAGKLTSNNNANTSTTGASQPGSFNGFKIFGIGSLNPYQNKWSIKARVTTKSDIKNYNNAKGPGRLFSVEFIDGTGEIKATGFQEQVDKFYDMLQVGNVYFISRGTLKAANKQYSKVNNDYEMTFGYDTVIEQCHEEGDDLPQMKLELKPLSEISNIAPTEHIDVIGVVKSVSDVTTIITKTTNKEMKKREICLVDNSNCSITCTLWGKQAEDFDGSEFPVILVKNARVGDYGGRCLSIGSDANLMINPDMPEAHTLRGWYDQGGAENVQSLTGGVGGSGGSQAGNGSTSSSYKTLDVLKDEKIGQGDKADYLSCKGTLLFAKKDNSMYMACPGENCNKKVIDQNDGTYRCEKCNKAYPNYNWRMILNINIADHADSNWATCFQETAETILGIRANELGELKSSNNPSYDEIFSSCMFKEYNFKLRAKVESYNDEKRVKVSVITVEEIDYQANARRLLNTIKAFAKTQI